MKKIEERKIDEKVTMTISEAAEFFNISKKMMENYDKLQELTGKEQVRLGIFCETFDWENEFKTLQEIYNNEKNREVVVVLFDDCSCELEKAKR